MNHLRITLVSALHRTCLSDPNYASDSIDVVLFLRIWLSTYIPGFNVISTSEDLRVMSYKPLQITMCDNTQKSLSVFSFP